MSRSLWLLLIAFFGFDRLAKGWALSHLRPFQEGPGFTVEIFGVAFKAFLRLVTNQGAAWGVFSNCPRLLTLIRIFMIVGIFYCVFQSKNLSKTARFWWLAIAVLATSNLLDVFFYGHIVDMIALGFDRWEFAVFNPADAVISMAWAVLFSLQFCPFKTTRRRIN